jgi:Terminase small subunit
MLWEYTAMVKKEAAGHSQSEEALKDLRHEAFARYVVEGKSHREAAILAGFSKKSASSQGSQLAKRLNIAKRIQFLQGQVAENTIHIVTKPSAFSLQSRIKRFEMYTEIHDRLWRIVKERAADPAMEKVPGGQSGFIVRTLKALGTGSNMKVVPEYTTDTALAKEIRAVAKQAAIELGQWKSDHDQPKPDKIQFCWVDPGSITDEETPAVEEQERLMLSPKSRPAA